MRAAAGVPGARTRMARRAPWPWNDQAGRFSWLKAMVLLMEVAPGADLAWIWAAGGLGPRPVTEIIHGTGLMAIRFLLLSLLVSPVRALFNWPRITLVRRQLGLTALFYAAAHLVLYALDQQWAMLHVISEIALRFYLTIGFVALLGLAVLGATSTDGSVRRMGRRWKQLHRLVYPLAALALFHYFLQSKADVSQPTVLAGIMLWLLLWRLLPAGADRAPLPIAGLGIAAPLLTLGVEYAWFALATKIDPARPVAAELDWSFGPHPAGQVLILGLSMAVAAALGWAAQRQRLQATLAFDVALYAGGALIVAAVAYAFALTDDWLPASWTIWQAAAMFVAAAAALGVARWAIRRWGAARARPIMDGVCVACLLAPLIAGLAL